ATSNTVRFASWPSTCSAHSANDEPKGSCMTRTMRVISTCTHTRSLFTVGNSLLKSGCKAVSHVKPGLFSNFNKTCGTGDVDLGEVVANHIKPDQQQPTPGQARSHGFGNFKIAGRQGLGNAAPARCQIAAGFASQR